MMAVKAMSQPAALVDALGCVARGDRAAFEELYRRTSAKLFGICLRICSSREEAEEALQDVYISVWQRAADYDARRGSAMTWLIMLARSRAIDRLRRTGRMATMPIEAAGEVADASPTAPERIDGHGEEQRLLDCFETIDPRDARFIRAAFFEGSTYAELAERAALPLGTMKSRIRRALIKLRDCMR